MLALALILAIVPCLLVFLAVYRFDTIEKEPPGLLLKLCLGGVLAYAVAYPVGRLGHSLLKSIYVGKSLMLFQLMDSFFLNALLEQALIFAVVVILTRKSGEFNYTFDAVVYAVTAAMGLTITANLVHVFKNGGSFQASALLLSIVGHAISAVFMGYFYGRSKNEEGAGDKKASRYYLAEAVLIPLVMYGIYDFCRQMQMTVFQVIFIVYEVVCAVMTVREIVFLSQHDMMLTGLENVELEEAEAVPSENAQRW